MAFSQPLSGSVKKSQAALMCELCENNAKLKWKCLECELMMCNRCKDKVHNKIASAQNHTIIDIKEFAKNQTNPELKPNLTRIKCGVHKGQNCCLYCKTCQDLVCLICVTNTHNEHKFGDISDEYKIKMEKFRNGQKNIEKEMRTLRVSEQKLKQIKFNEQSNYGKVRQEIIDYDKALKEEIQKHTDKLLKELDQKWEVISKYIDGEKKKLVKQQEQIQKQRQELNTLLHPSNAKDVISESESLIKSMETNVSPLDTSFQGVPKFTCGNKTKIPLIFGKLEGVSIQFNTELQVNKRFKTDLTCIDNIASNPDGSLWISNSLSDVFQKVKQNGDNLSVIFDCEMEVVDISFLPSGDLLLCLEGFSNLKLIPFGSTDIQDSVYTISPLSPTGIHGTCDNKVMVGAVNSGMIIADGPRHTLVVMMDQTGHREKVFQYDRHGKPLFTYPRRVTSNSQGNIAVIDLLEDRGLRVVVFGQDGEVRNIYTGHPDVNNEHDEEKQFQPENITTTPSDNFVVADILTHALHILNSEGEIITFYNIEEIGILLPQSLSFSSTGQLYIGCGTYNNSEDNADIFVIKNFIF